MIKCKNCKNQVERYGSNGLLHHLKVEENCFHSYSAEEIAGLEELEIRANKSKKQKKRVSMETEKWAVDLWIPRITSHESTKSILFLLKSSIKLIPQNMKKN